LAKGLSRNDLLAYARQGAEARIEQLRTELAALEAAFGTGRSGGQRGRGPSAANAQGAPKARKMSAAGRKRIADAARKRWAKWRAEKGKK